MRKGRQPFQLREIRVTPGYNRFAEGSALVEWGDTRVLATVTVENKLPPHLRGKKGRVGWLTAEYAMLPRSTAERTQRERLYAGGRSLEIQRLIGRSLRSVTDLTLFHGQTLTVDVDVLQADGGTRCAGILAGYAALHHAAGRLVRKGALDEWPLTHEVAAVSVGVVRGETLLDLDFHEDAAAEIDLNVVATADGKLVEVQGSGEERPIDAGRYVELVAQGISAVQGLLAHVRGSFT
ncbi:ribonuclease PH [Truepera radiovictrix]|uniref:Ribonuclease PH n=1 Tax=Truepera radiovictrix (strain DSM 17093 / CIP 108686 / LMG 22925 / RQ-24) TaxID=649638 RepID=D7CS85_TRURR|nr:ribonuclease PH [Truepera radiovictrix]ADI13617.1 ribonuclease PH [Truepera radiovictrix DSM 17093]WMT57821.1 ribonuclease PH [Truepera radiovictrix]